MYTRTNDLSILIGKLNGDVEALEKEISKSENINKEKITNIKNEIKEIEEELDSHKQEHMVCERALNKKLYKIYVAVGFAFILLFILSQNNEQAKAILDKALSIIF